MLADLLTGGAALFAAVLSGVNVWLTRRWQERDQDAERRGARQAWLRDSLKQALVDHINLSFRTSRTCSEARVAEISRDQTRKHDFFVRAKSLHVEYLDLIIFLRLFGTPKIVTTAEQLHAALDTLQDVTFWEQVSGLGEEPFVKAGTSRPEVTFDKAQDDCMGKCEALINEVRDYLELPKDAVIDRTI